MEICEIDISKVTYKNAKLHNINRYVFYGATFSIIILIVAYFPLEDGQIKGHMYEPVLSVIDHWYVITIAILIFFTNEMIKRTNRKIVEGRLMIDESKIIISFDNEPIEYSMNEIKYIELNGDYNLYLKSKKEIYNLDINSTKNLKYLNMILYKLASSNRVKVEIID